MAVAGVHFLASLAALAMVVAVSPVTADLTDDLDVLWGKTQLLYDNNGSQILKLTLDQNMGSAFRTKNAFLFGRIDFDIMLVPDNSAGTVTTIYMMSEGKWDIHDEIDLEFLGNMTGQPYTLHTNIFANGQGGREQQYRLWFDPTEDFHLYSIIWNPQGIIIMVDNTPIRQHKNNLAAGIPFPIYQPMQLYGCIWDAEDWATEGGRVKTDWSQAPFIASFRNFSDNACVQSQNSWVCGQGSSSGSGWFDQGLDGVQQAQLKNVQDNYKIYDYCTDSERFPDGFPKECGLQ